MPNTLILISLLPVTDGQTDGHTARQTDGVQCYSPETLLGSGDNDNSMTDGQK